MSDFQTSAHHHGLIARCTAALVVNEVSDIGAKDLLGALVAFLQPLIQKQGKKIIISSRTGN